MEHPLDQQANAEELARAALARAFTVVSLCAFAFFWSLPWLAVFDGLSPVSSPIWRQEITVILFRLAWAIATACILVIPYSRRRRWAWAACTGFLFAESAGIAAWIVLSAMRSPETFPLYTLAQPLTWVSAGISLAAISSFAARADFSVERRAGWRTMMREGSWALWLTAVAEAGALLWWWVLVR